MKPREQQADLPASLLYDSPEIYDVAFGWDLGMELDFVESCFRKHAPNPIERVLEPACGTGRILAGLAERGYEVAGYDANPGMVAFASAKLARFSGQIMRGDMATFRPPGRYDAAINLVNTIGYLLEEDAVASHLDRVGEAIRPGGLYIVQFNYGGEPPEQGAFGPWSNTRRDLKTSLTWRVVREDPVALRSYQECRIVAEWGRERRTIEESHVLRYWTQEDFDRIVEASPFDLAAVYFDRFEEKPLDESRTGIDGNLYHVLWRRE